jgi:hypothetical protein
MALKAIKRTMTEILRDWHDFMRVLKTIVVIPMVRARVGIWAIGRPYHAPFCGRRSGAAQGRSSRICNAGIHSLSVPDRLQPAQCEPLRPLWFHIAGKLPDVIRLCSERNTTTPAMAASVTSAFRDMVRKFGNPLVEINHGGLVRKGAPPCPARPPFTR